MMVGVVVFLLTSSVLAKEVALEVFRGEVSLEDLRAEAAMETMYKRRLVGTFFLK